ncbi:hypothetical protein [Hymenobacter terricola]|uniref:hypothetical protein n=1 Tax=Hymenobacter terricola TaxID=2819236 RepID=UPI001B301E47|nr:hypothetical protein [Hymenobacter terricola]
MKKTPLFIAVAAAALTFASCKKEEEKAVASPQAVAATSVLANADLLTAGNWHQTGLTVSVATEAGKPAATSDLFLRAKPSRLIQNAAYKADGTFTLLRGPLSDGKIADPALGKWHLNAAADSLVATEQDHLRSYGIAELTASTLRLTSAAPAADGKASICTITTTFAH